MHSPTALAVAKAAINADQDGSAGIALMGGHITRLFYMSDEALESQTLESFHRANYKARL